MTLTNGIPTGVPTFGSGASGNLSIAIVTSGQLAGNASLSYASSATNVAGNFVASQAYTIDIEDQAKVMQFKFYYQAVSGTMNFSGTSSNSFGVAAYDVTNSVWLSVAGGFNMVQGTGVGMASGTFQTNSNTGSIRFVVYNVTATTGATTLYVDDFFVGPQITATAPAVTDWIAYTPTFPTSAFGTVTNLAAFYRRVGDCIHLNISFTTGTVTGAAALLPLPTGLSVDVSKFNTVTNSIVGQMARSANSASTVNILVTPTTTTALALGQQASGQGGLTPINGNAGLTSTLQVAFNTWGIPVIGWSSNTSASSDTDTRVVAAKYYKTATVSTTAANPINFDGLVLDTHGAVTTGASWQYKIPVSGNYQISAYVGTATAGYVYVYKNAVLNSTLGYVGVDGVLMCGEAIIPCVSGDTIDIRPGSTSSINGNASLANSSASTISINRLSGPAVITATESVNMRYFSSASVVTGSLATVMYSTKGWDTHAAYNATTGIYTAPVSGKYQVNASIAMTGTFILNSVLDLQVQQAGSASQVSEAKAFSGGAVTQMNTNVGDIFYLQAGDSLQVQVSNTGTLPVIAATTTQNWLSIARVGN